MKRKAGLILAILLPLQIAAIRVISNYPEFVEEWYSTGIYPIISTFMRAGLGLIPFSLGDLLYALLAVLLIRWLVIRFRQRFRNPKKWGLEALATLSLIYACFNLFWGLNYYRPPLHQALGIKNDYTTEELQRLTIRLIEKANELHYAITQNDSLKVDMPYSRTELLKMSVEGYDHLRLSFPQFSYNRASLKPSLYSVPLSYMGFNGYLNPLTNEGQVNTVIVPYKIPTTASHEVGHQLGFAKENEANFLACMATMNHPDAYFKYSGYTFALGYCLNEMFRREPALARELSERLNFGIHLNYLEVRQFWEAHKNPFEPLFMFTYNSFLKANYQAEGMKTYSYVVALLVNYFDERPELL